jgi:hypothetical protein
VLTLPRNSFVAPRVIKWRLPRLLATHEESAAQAMRRTAIPGQNPPDDVDGYSDGEAASP